MSVEPPRRRDSKYRLLYLGNDLKLIAVVRQDLPEADYRLVACGDREGARLFLESDIRYDALLIDFEWRGKEGLKLAELALSLQHRKGMPIMFLAAAQLASDLQKLARKAGVKSFAAKTPEMRSVIERSGVYSSNEVITEGFAQKRLWLGVRAGASPPS